MQINGNGPKIRNAVALYYEYFEPTESNDSLGTPNLQDSKTSKTIPRYQDRAVLVPNPS
jgi:hypothetical protein